MDPALQSRIDLGRKLVEEQSEYFASRFGQVKSDWKSDGSRVTEADIHLSLVFADAIGEVFPADQFFSEELDHGDEPLEVSSEYAWLIDPIDGTNNFARRVPTCSISLALLRRGDPVYGYIYDHASRAIIHGGPGLGGYVGDDRLPGLGSGAAVDRHSLVSVQSYASEDAIRDEIAVQRVFKIRAFGSSAVHMAYAAAGWTDGVVAHKVKAWDIAGGVAIMRGVGGSTRFFGEPVFPMRSFSTLAKGFAHIAGSPQMCDALEKTLGCGPLARV